MPSPARTKNIVRRIVNVRSLREDGTTVSGSTSVTAASYTIPANTLNAGDVIRITTGIIVDNTGGAANEDVDINIGLTGLDTDVIFDTAGVAILDNIPAESWWFWSQTTCTMRTVGSAGTANAWTIWGAEVADTTITPFLDRVAEAAVDTTAAVVVTLGVDGDDTNPPEVGVTVETFIVEVLGSAGAVTAGTADGS